jgi:hypothetical protein
MVGFRSGNFSACLDLLTDHACRHNEVGGWFESGSVDVDVHAVDCAMAAVPGVEGMDAKRVSLFEDLDLLDDEVVVSNHLRRIQPFQG